MRRSIYLSISGGIFLCELTSMKSFNISSKTFIVFTDEWLTVSTFIHTSQRNDPQSHSSTYDKWMTHSLHIHLALKYESTTVPAFIRLWQRNCSLSLHSFSYYTWTAYSLYIHPAMTNELPAVSTFVKAWQINDPLFLHLSTHDKWLAVIIQSW